MYLIKNATVFAPKALGKQDVLFCNDRIVQIGQGLSPSIDGLTVLDAKGKYLTPGLIDQHVHLIGGGGEGGLHTRTPEFNLSMAIRSGVTTVVGVLGTDSFTRSVEALVAKTKGLKNEGITAFCLTGAYRFPSDTVTGSVAKDMVYIDEVLGCKLAMADHRASHPTRDEIIRLVSDIRMAGLVGGKPGVLHIHMGAAEGGTELLMDIVKTTDIPIWHFRPTHMGRHLDETRAFTALGGYADITAKADSAPMLWELMQQCPAGLITLSSDSNGSLPVWNDQKEIIGVKVGEMTTLTSVIQKMVLECGLTLEQALPPVTSSVAAALRLERKGALRPGADADLVLFDEAMQVDSVFAMGRPMMRDQKLLVKGTFEQ